MKDLTRIEIFQNYFKKMKVVLFIKNSVFRLLKYIIKHRVSEEYSIIFFSFKVSKVYKSLFKISADIKNIGFCTVIDL